jgi:starvation-inducible DNA-binding protein
MAPNPKSNTKADVATALSALLADTYTLAFKTHGYHWNVTGDKFHDLHILFEGQYGALYEAADDIAERIRALGFPVAASFAAFAKESKIEALGDAPKQLKMVEALRDAHVHASKTAAAAAKVADDHGDIGSADLATQRIRDHDKAAWMLSSILA